MTIERLEILPGYSISRLLKGGWHLSSGHGASVGQKQAIDDMAAFVEAGITTFDCADHYLGVEQLIGDFRRAYPDLGRRLQVHTKYVPDWDALATLSRADTVRIIDRSLQRLGVETLDLVQFFWWNGKVPGAVTTALVLKDLQREGKIRHIGVTNFTTPQLGEMIDAGVPIAVNQLQYSLVDDRPERSQLEFCRAHDIAVVTYGHLLGGFISADWIGTPEAGEPFANRSLRKYKLIIEDFGGWALFQELLAALKAIGDRFGVGPGEVALRWTLDRPGIAGCIVGATSTRHLARNLKVFDIALTDADRARIAAICARRTGPLGDCYELENDRTGRHGRIMRPNQNSLEDKPWQDAGTEFCDRAFAAVQSIDKAERQERETSIMTTFKTLLLAGIAGVLFAGSAAACPAKIGAVLSMTGSYATFGPPISNAAALAVEQLSAAGWKVGDCTKLEYIVRDDQTQPSVGVDAARRLVDLDAVGAIVGPITSGVTGPMLSSVTVDKGVLVIVSASSSPTFTDMARAGKLKGLFFRVLPSDALQAVAAAKIAWDAGYRKIAVVNLNNDWGNNLGKQFAATFKAMGGEITGPVTYNAEQPSYRAEVNKALEAKPEAVYIAATPIDGSKILRDWISLGGTQKFIFPLGMNDAKVVEQIGDQYLKDAWFVTPGAPQPNSRSVFYETYEKRYNLDPGKGPGPGRDSGYDAAALIGLAMMAAKDYKDGKAIAAAIGRVTDPNGTPIMATVEDYKKAVQLLGEGKTIRYVGATGPMTYDQYGDVSTPFVGWQLENKIFIQKKNVSAQDVADIKAKTGT